LKHQIKGFKIPDGGQISRLREIVEDIFQTLWENGMVTCDKRMQLKVIAQKRELVDQ